jgi:hypothetical protein
MYTIKRLTEILDLEKHARLHDLVEDLLSHEMSELLRFKEPRRAYSLMCSLMIDRFFAMLTGG